MPPPLQAPTGLLGLHVWNLQGEQENGKYMLASAISAYLQEATRRHRSTSI